MKITPKRQQTERVPVLNRLREGMDYVNHFEPMKAILALLGLISLLGLPYTVLMPVFAREVLGGDARTMGYLIGASGLGALGGAVYMASRRDVRGHLVRIAAAAFLFGVSLALFSFSKNAWLSGALLVFVGFGMMVQTIASNIVLQTLVDDDKRGRVMSFFTMAFMGMAPFGSLMAGVLASRLGGPWTLLAGAVACTAAAAVFALRLPSLRKAVREAYLRKGVFPPPSLSPPG